MVSTTSPVRRRTVTIAVAAVLTLLALMPSVAAAQSAPLQFGAFSPGDPYNGRVDNTNALQNQLGRRIDLVNWYQNWGGGDWVSSVQDQLVNASMQNGRTPMITWEPWDPAAGVNQPKYSLANIAKGDFDAYIRSWAIALKGYGRTINLRPMHEMNGNWYPWAGSVNGNSPALYIQAWRRMHDIFAQAGASNVRWVFSPNNTDVGGKRMEEFYPGAGYVDVLAVDGYNWGSTAPANGGWQSFNEVFKGAYDRLAKLGGQPIWLAEVGCAPQGGNKAAWIRDMFTKARTMSRLKAIIWFNENKEQDWRGNATAQTAAAFHPASAQAKLKLTTKSRARTGTRATVRWKATRATTVKTWHTYLNGKRVRVLKGTKSKVMRKRISRPGKNRWTIIGRDATGHNVVKASKSFRATR
jgi:beta-mannanase